MAYTERRYCPVCKRVTTFVCKDKASGYYCSRCGYRLRGEEIYERGKGDKRRIKEAKGGTLEKGARPLTLDMYNKVARGED